MAGDLGNHLASDASGKGAEGPTEKGQFMCNAHY